jgi:hypothetical protein
MTRWRLCVKGYISAAGGLAIAAVAPHCLSVRHPLIRHLSVYPPQFWRFPSPNSREVPFCEACCRSLLAPHCNPSGLKGPRSLAYPIRKWVAPGSRRVRKLGNKLLRKSHLCYP